MGDRGPAAAMNGALLIVRIDPLPLPTHYFASLIERSPEYR